MKSLVWLVIVGAVFAVYALFIDPAVDRHDREMEEHQRQKQEQLFREHEHEWRQQSEERRRVCHGLPSDSGCWGNG